MDNQEALIKQGLEYPYTEGVSAGGSTITTVKFKEIELQLTVTPHITPDGRVSMRLKLQKKDIAGFTDAGEFGSRVPFLNTKEAETEFLMENGDTIVIGGIKKTTERIAGEGLPWLSKIPILGWLFKNRTDDNSKEELLIFITPQILKLQQYKSNTAASRAGTF
jgi:type IV pilus assembly protein PilQ